MLIDGKWTANWQPVQKADEKGRFVRQESSFRNWITPDGSAGPTGTGGFTAEAGRYRLYVALICPWASRTLIARKLKGLEEIIPVTVVNPRLDDQGWSFGGFPGADADPLYGASHLHELYTRADPHVSGRATVPVLWDEKQGVMVNNESADIVRMFDTAFEDIAPSGLRLAPEDLVEEIDRESAQIYRLYNNGVYKAGFASSQEAYDEAVTQLFDEMARIEARLSDGRPFYFGDRLTETDIRIFVTSIRFDAAYHGLFKCNIRRLEDHPHMHAHMLRMLSTGGIAETVDLDHIKAGYYGIKALNPPRIIPAGPAGLEAQIAAAKAALA
ncbi:glutathione S-transferase family protein [Salipiger sp. PrR002]|uniref:glutathione S-transferase family protein n=1 Tax=Salipiger sp. PrR002 TaxID=2706489 RepID=UPI0013B5ECD0|nr:glutathione S-transferase C-terminal domain-containing protein [Salipiger sp. PrR002]NDV98934.1 glutathione S-transferase family protein [Salipiger sp. PrR002]NDW55671.1 glutathione S-transferase family protein [Salipiger sp. PrR004]